MRLVRAHALRCFAVLWCPAMASCVEPTDSSPSLPDPDAIDPVEGHCSAESASTEDPFADCVEAFEPAEGVSFGHDAMPDIVLGPPQGGGERMGGTHVASLGCGGSITLHFSDPWPIDGEGPDLVVFENAFIAGSSTFVEPAQVLVSEDGEAWYAFPCDPSAEDPEGCAGLSPVLDVDAAADPRAAGGDAFDLADVGLEEARYLRLVDRTFEHYQTRTWCEGAAGGFDLDAVAVLEPSS
ncbi:MAG: cell surface protein [Myxococcales bacterium]|nr:cell surface protein [Myxococcales bacterium]